MHPWQFIALLGAVIVIYALVLPKSSSPSRQTNMIKEIEETIEHFAAEIEEENKELLKLVADMKKDGENQTLKLLGRIESIEKQLYEVSIGLDQKSKPTTDSHVLINTKSASVNQAPIESQERTGTLDTNASEETLEISHMNIKERYLELLLLDKQGKSIEYIAKKLGMNKGEIQLILQLARQEEHFRV